MSPKLWHSVETYSQVMNVN